MPIDPMSPGGLEFFDRSAQAVLLRKRGHDWAEIAEELDLGVGAKGMKAAKAMVFEALSTMVAPETMAETKALMLAEMGELKVHLWRRITSSHGYDDAAIGNLLKTMAGQSKISGLETIRVSVKADFDDIMKALSAGIPDDPTILDAEVVDESGDEEDLQTF